MEITLFHKNLDPKEIEKFTSYVETKLEAIESLLTKFADDAKLLKISVEKFEKHDAFEVEFILNLPTKALVSKEASHEYMKAIDLAKDRLIAQIKKHMAHLRNDRSHASIRTSKELKQEVPVEEKV